MYNFLEALGLKLQFFADKVYVLIKGARLMNVFRNIYWKSVRQIRYSHIKNKDKKTFLGGARNFFSLRFLRRKPCTPLAKSQCPSLLALSLFYLKKKKNWGGKRYDFLYLTLFLTVVVVYLFQPCPSLAEFLCPFLLLWRTLRLKIQ